MPEPFGAAFAGAEAWWSRLFGPGLGRPASGVELSCSPGGGLAAFTALSFDKLEGAPSKSIALVDLASGRISQLKTVGGTSCRPSWSPDGDRLAFISDRDQAGHFVPFVVEIEHPESAVCLPLGDLSAESVEWSGDGRSLVVVAAEAGADQAAVSGSGRALATDGSGSRPSWAPEVLGDGVSGQGWRRALRVDVESGQVRTVSTPGINVWEACVAGDALLAVVSSAPAEGDWGNSRLELMALDGSWRRRVYQPRRQLGHPAASPDGTRLAVVTGLASDRGVVAGDLILVDPDGSGGRRLESGGVDVTWIQFRDSDHLAFGGVKELDAVFAEIGLSSGRVTTHLAGEGTTAGDYPSASLLPQGGLLLLSESWRRPPAVARAEGGRLREVVSFPQPGYQWLLSQLGPLGPLEWESSDGLRVTGLWAPPSSGPGPHPTVLLVHGGPASLWTPRWPGRIGMMMLAAYLNSQGYALLLPNPRGSSGRGQHYLEMEVGDYGGGEVDDHLAGIDALVAMGVADPSRLAVIGGSHGGYMASWLTTRCDRFRAAVAVSPVTDWYSQHFGSNIPDFDALFLGSEIGDGGGVYFERSPVFFAGHSRTPTLLTAGLRDRCTPPGQAIEFHQALLARGVETELVLYPEEGHGVRSLPAHIDLGARIADFLGRHLAQRDPETATPGSP